MFKYLIYLAVFSFLQTCSAQQKQSTSHMEKFNIQEFDANKKGGEYTKLAEDGTIITRFGDSTGYFEKIIPPEGWFYTYREYYGNGNLKTAGEVFKRGDFQAGVWPEYSSDGRKLRETNHDEPYKMTLEEILALLEKEKIPFARENKFNSIRRTVTESGALWIVEWKMTEGRKERVFIDDATGVITKKDFYGVQEDT